MKRTLLIRLESNAASVRKLVESSWEVVVSLKEKKNLSDRVGYYLISLADTPKQELKQAVAFEKDSAKEDSLKDGSELQDMEK